MFGKGGFTMMSGVECNGSETELHLCHSNRSDGAICDHASAGLICNREYSEFCIVTARMKMAVFRYYPEM